MGWAVAFLIAAVIVAILGFAGSATTLALMAKVLFWVFVVGMVVSLAMHERRHLGSVLRVCGRRPAAEEVTNST